MLPARSQKHGQCQYCEQPPACQGSHFTLHLSLPPPACSVKLPHVIVNRSNIFHTSPPFPPLSRHPSLCHPSHQAMPVLRVFNNTVFISLALKQYKPCLQQPGGWEPSPPGGSILFRCISARTENLGSFQLINHNLLQTEHISKPVGSPPPSRADEECSAAHPSLI